MSPTQRPANRRGTADPAQDRGADVASPDVVSSEAHRPIAEAPGRLAGRERGGDGWKEFATVFVPLVIVFPGVAATAATAVYLTASFFTDPRDNGVFAVLVGAAVGVAAWVVAAVLLRRLSRADGANPSVYGELVREYLSLRARLDSIPSDDPRWLASREAAFQLDSVAAELGVSGLGQGSVGAHWTIGFGYTAIWRRLHRADECLLPLEPAATIAGQALYDEMRLQGARMPMSASLTAKLRQAIVIVDPESAGFLEHPPRAGGGADKADPEARSMLRQVRHTINDFRDDRRDGLVRARNNLLGTTLYTSTIAYIVLGLAMITATPERIVTAAVAFFLVGAAVGLFRHLRMASARDTVMEEDYGLATARLIQRPLFSGLAAVGGVILTGLLPKLTPPGTATAAASTTLDRIFDLTAHPEYLVVAAVFGLTPTLLMTGLQRQVESYKADLKSSESAESQ